MHKKKHHHEEHEEHVNHEAWVIPYADMLTLLMAMFLVLWAIGQVDVSKAKAVSTGFADEFGLSSSAGAGSGGVGVLDGNAVPDTPDKLDMRTKVDKTMAIAAQKRQEDAHQAEQESMAKIEQDIANGIGGGLGGSVKFHMEARGLIVSIVSEGVLFDAGSAEIKPAGRIILDDIAAQLAGISNNLSIEGHTDNTPIATAQFPSNWELSTSRAAAVLRYLESRHGLPQIRLSAAGYADQRPIAPNDTVGGRSQNRRVDIAIISENPAPAASDASANPSPAGDTSGATPDLAAEAAVTPGDQPAATNNGE